MNRGILWAVPTEPIAFTPIFPVIPHQHITLLFGVNKLDVEGFIGKEFVGKIVAIAANDVIQAAQVELPKLILCQNKHPHITISHAEGAEPSWSNAMLEQPNPQSFLEILGVAIAVNFVIKFKEFEDRHGYSEKTANPGGCENCCNTGDGGDGL